MREFKIRASGSGQITGVKGLGKTGEGYCEKWLICELFNREFSINSKFLEKGNLMEAESILELGKYLDLKLEKNELFFADEYFSGTPDIITDTEIIDMKNSWKIETFPMFEKDIPDKAYFYQMQIYMHLTGLKKARLVYMLLDTPTHLIEKEAYFFSKSQGFEEVEMEIYDRFEKQMTYLDIPIEKRIKTFEIEYSEKEIEFLKSRVLDCRTYINSLI